ncbi:phospholipid/cholesterol/gamma-HCH transport system substrate-binding protein [Amycolatopsis marina]|uniref:Phospholipid/cholesterol/gamma-HCH transport system substrate-binding protein n=1 Tax=Amycolatopsis marina TaxID=490629 RepID=A0A1I1CJK1_9PSEU|nr:MCE family protein [Amycolatopsis marina]SFB62899.1 phospholipid/cholesterol/gamma-HCH transport system substrate-binding protein [Amycolatopsis marina]
MTNRFAKTERPVWRRRGRARATALTVLLVLVTGCGRDGFDGMYDVPLPGGADLGPRPYRVIAEFTNVLDLVPQSGVKVNDVAVGAVERVELAEDGRTALLTLAVNGAVELPANAVARLRQTSVLGEKFVELAPPELGTPTGELGDGAVIPVERTERGTEIEEVFGALSLLLGGGGIAQIKTINRELNAALSGNESAARSLIGNLDEFVTGLDEHKAEISRALDGVNELAGTLAARTAQIDEVLTDLTPGVEALSEQREALVAMLTALADLSDVAVDTVNRTKDDLVADLTALEPTLRELAESGAALPAAMQTLLTFPFPDVALDAIRGDYLNSFLDFNTRTSGAGGVR